MEHLALQSLGAIAAAPLLFLAIAFSGRALAGAVGLGKDEAALPALHYVLGMLALSALGFIALFGWIGPLGALALLAALVAGGWRLSAWRDQAIRLWPLLPMLAVAGLYLALFNHGPSPTLGGSPSGDLDYYATQLFDMARHPGAGADIYANGFQAHRMLFANIPLTIGAALVRGGLADPFLFLTVTTPLLCALWLAVLLREWLLPDATAMAQLAALVLAACSPGYLYWLLESPPVAVALPLAALPGALLVRLPSLRLLLVAGFGGALLLLQSKLTALGFLAPALLVPLWTIVRRWNRAWQIATCTAAGLAVAGFCLLLRYSFAPYIAALGLDRVSLLPPIFRDGQSALIAGLMTAAFVAPFLLSLRLALPGPVRAGAAITSAICGLVALYISSVAIVALRMDMVLLGLLLLWSRRIGWLDMCLVLLTAFGAVNTELGASGLRGAIAHLLFALVLAAAFLPLRAGPLFRIAALALPTAIATAGVLAIFAMPGLRDRVEHRTRWLFGPDDYGIWNAVDRLTPEGALVFTDQTGEAIDPHHGWNTYAAMGRRQLFISSWYNVLPLRNDKALRMRALNQNGLVLAGRLSAQAADSGRHAGYYAVVAASRTAPGTLLFANGSYRLYRLPG